MQPAGRGSRRSPRNRARSGREQRVVDLVVVPANIWREGIQASGDRTGIDCLQQRVEAPGISTEQVGDFDVRVLAGSTERDRAQVRGTLQEHVANFRTRQNELRVQKRCRIRLGNRDLAEFELDPVSCQILLQRAPVKTRDPVLYQEGQSGRSESSQQYVNGFGAPIVERSGRDQRADSAAEKNVGETGDPDVKPGVVRTFTIKNMKPGAYVLVCNIAEHYGLGMRAAFTVT